MSLSSLQPETRVLCVWCPDFAVWASRLKDPTLGGVPVILGGIPPERGNVQGLSPEARASGVRVGMTLSAARAILPEARFLRLDAEAERAAWREVLDVLQSYAPTVEGGVPGRITPGARAFFVDTRGLDRLHGDAETLGARVAARVRSLGYPARLGIASSKLVAEVAAMETESGLRSIPYGQERRFLEPLPLSRLPFGEERLAELASLGLHTVGDWIALPPETVRARFGRAGLELHALARGVDPRPLVPAPEAGDDAVLFELDDPTEDLDRLTFHLKNAVDTLCAQLAARGLAAGTVRAVLTIERGEPVTREARFVRPTVSARLILDCLRLALTREPLTGPVVRARLRASQAVEARPEQLLLFAQRHATLNPAAVEEALARVRALLGPDRIVSPRPADAHRPEQQIDWHPYDLPAPATPCRTSTRTPGRAAARESSRLPAVHPAAAPPPGPALAGLPARLLSPPQPAVVSMRGTRPATLRCDMGSGAVVGSSGPHVLDGAWWSDDPFARAYYVLTLSGGERYWVYKDLQQRSWYLHGVFD